LDGRAARVVTSRQTARAIAMTTGLPREYHKSYTWDAIVFSDGATCVHSATCDARECDANARERGFPRALAIDGVGAIPRFGDFDRRRTNEERSHGKCFQSRARETSIANAR